MTSRFIHGARSAAVLLSACTALVATSTWSGSLDFGNGLAGRYTLTLGYSLALRTGAPSRALTDGPIDPQSGLPSTANYDDGDRNFRRYAPVNHRASALGELDLSWSGYGLVARGDAFYDRVYHERNDNDSPDTVNKDGRHDRFTRKARKFNGGRLRALDLYAYADWPLGDGAELDLRLGRQLVAWGEGLFFGNIAFSQGPSDATKINIPGIDVKSILLPVEQASLNLGLSEALTLMGYYRLRYRPSELEPVGAYFSTVDIVGPGASFVYGFRNPFYDPLANPQAFAPEQLQGLLALLFPDGVPQPLPLSLAGMVPGAQPIITVPRGPDQLPGDDGQWGLGLKYQVTPATNVGLYLLRYHDTLPAVVLNPGFPQLAAGITTAPTPAPVSYQLSYFEGIELGGASFSTKLGAVNLAGEALYRDGANVLVEGPFGPTSTRAKLSQAFVSAVMVLPPNVLSQQIDLVGELGYIHVHDTSPVEGGGKRLVNDRDAVGFQGIATFNYRNVFSKWDLALPLTLGALVKGTPAMAGAMGALYGEGDIRAALAANFTYLQNLQLGISYNAFLGTPSIAERPFADRDYAALSVKYSF